VTVQVPKWWNWQTRHLEGVVGKLVGVRVPPSAPKPTQIFQSKFSKIEYPQDSRPSLNSFLGVGVGIGIDFFDPDVRPRFFMEIAWTEIAYFFSVPEPRRDSTLQD
jgi:hypothetical protein